MAPESQRAMRVIPRQPPLPLYVRRTECEKLAVSTGSRLPIANGRQASVARPYWAVIGYPGPTHLRKQRTRAHICSQALCGRTRRVLPPCHERPGYTESRTSGSRGTTSNTAQWSFMHGAEPRHGEPQQVIRRGQGIRPAGGERGQRRGLAAELNRRTFRSGPHGRPAERISYPPP